MTLLGPRSMAVHHGGVFLAGEVAEPLWRFLRASVAAHERDGASVRPEIREAIEALRLAAMHHLAMSANGHAEGHSVVLEPLSETQVVTTSGLAGLLGVGTRQARRLAASEGLQQLSRDCWRRADALALVDARRRDRKSDVGS